MYNEKQVVSLLLCKNNIEYNFCIKKKTKSFPGIFAGDMLLAVLHTESLKEAGELLGVSARTIERSIKIFIDNFTSAPTIVKLLHSVSLHKCNLCRRILELSPTYFWKNNSSNSGFQSNCIECKKSIFKNYYSNNKNKIINNVGKRKLLILRATPKWADVEKIENIYKNCKKGFHVDHIVPLQGEYVSGLHVEYNLQYLTAEDNIKKGNKWEVS